MKKFISVFLLMVLIITSVFTLSSCAIEKVSDKQLVEDLSTNIKEMKVFKEKDKNKLDSSAFEVKTFEYSSHDITKRQTNLDEKEDIIYCDLIVKNANYSVVIECKIEYDYYDEGGWILDDIEIFDRQITPTKTFNNEEILKGFINSKMLAASRPKIAEVLGSENDGVEVLESEILSADDGYVMCVTVQYQKSLTVLEGTVEIQWDDERGWCWPSLDDEEDYLKTLTPQKIVNIGDYKKALGKFSGEAGYSYYHEFCVDSIDVENGTAVVRASTSYWRDNGKAFTCPFDAYTGSIDLSETGMPYDLFEGLSGVSYDPTDDSWSGFERIS